LCTALSLAGNTLATERITWKPVVAAVLKIDGQPAKLWNVYQAEKKRHLILVQLGRRFLKLDTRAHEVYELGPDQLERKGRELRTKNDEKLDKPLLSADWVVRDAGRARLVRVRLSDEGRILEVQLPLEIDLRSLY